MPKFTLYLTHVLNKKIRTNLTASQIEVNGTSDAQKLFQIQPVRKWMLEIRVNRTVFLWKLQWELDRPEAVVAPLVEVIRPSTCWLWWWTLTSRGLVTFQAQLGQHISATLQTSSHQFAGKLHNRPGTLDIDRYHATALSSGKSEVLPLTVVHWCNSFQFAKCEFSVKGGWYVNKNSLS